MTDAYDVLVCGPVSWNQIVHLRELPEARPHTTSALSHLETLGGTSAGKAVHLTALGRRVRLHTVWGSDAAARRIAAVLDELGVEVHARVVPGSSERHLNLMDPYGGRVSIYLDHTEPGDAVVPTATDLRSARAAVIDLSGPVVALITQVRDSGVPVWTDLHDYDGVAAFHRPFLEAADYVFLNDDGLRQPLDFLHAVVEGGARAAVCTLGADGAIAVDGDHVVHRVAATPVVEVVDTNGAGDAFLAGFLDATLDGASIPQALAAGAGQAVTALGSPHLGPLLDAVVGDDAERFDPVDTGPRRRVSPAAVSEPRPTVEG